VNETTLGPGLKDAWKHAFRVGAEARGDPAGNGGHAALLRTHFSSVTAGNAMRWDRFQPEEGVFSPGDADRLVDFARFLGLAIRGRALLGHGHAPAWVFSGPNGTVSPAGLEARLDRHAEALIGRYRGIVGEWDVLEGISDPGGPDGFLDTPWYRIGGEEIFAKALEAAHRADPSARLFYGDRGMESLPRRENALRIVSGLLDRGAPLHGVGIRGRWTVDEPTEENLRRTFEAFTVLGTEIALTSLSVSPRPPGEEETLEAQARQYGTIFRVAADFPAVTSVTLRGLTDGAMGYGVTPKGRENGSFLFTAGGEAKPALSFLIDAGYSLMD